jgi:hypothetical protein
MKIRSFATLGSFMLLAAASVYGQTPAADIPFEFHVGNVVLPAGHYEVNASANNLQEVLSIECSTSQAHALVPTYNLAGGPGARANGRLVFHKYGGEYFLSEVWLHDRAQGSGLNESKIEREIARVTPPAQTSLVLLAQR